MSLKKKAAQIDLGMLVAGAVANSGQSANPLNQAPAASGMTAIGMHAETVYKDRKISAENESLKAELAGWAGATPAQKLDPLMATPNCPTYGHPNCSTLIGQIVYFWTVWFGLSRMAISPWIFIKRLNGQAQRVRPKAPSLGAVGNCHIGA